MIVLDVQDIAPARASVDVRREMQIRPGKARGPAISEPPTADPPASCTWITATKGRADLDGILPKAAGAALVVDESGTVLIATDQACHLLKYRAGELDGQPVETLMPERFRLAHIGHRLRFTDDRRTRPMGAGLDLFTLCKDGSELPVDISLNPVQRGLRTLVVVVVEARASAPQTSSAK